MMIAVMESQSFAKAYPELASQWSPRNAASPHDVRRSSNKAVWWHCPQGHEWEASPNSRVRPGGRVCGCPYCSGRRVTPGVNDLATTHPALAAQWHAENPIPPTMVHTFSNKTFLWSGPCGHIWEAAVASRTKQAQGCPFCSGHRVLEGFNDLRTTHPHLASEWADSRPVTRVSHGSLYQAEWRCPKGHVWASTVIQRTTSRNSKNCPVCSGREVRAGVNDLATTHPALAAQWHVNNTVQAHEVTFRSSLKALWACGEGHQWSSRVRDRVHSTVEGCPVCAGSVLMEGVNDLATLYPELVRQWVSASKGPHQIRPQSLLQVQWVCDEGHVWHSSVAHRVNGHGCPFCAGQRVIVGKNDLLSQHPDVAKQWHPDNDKTPDLVASGSSTAYYWLCEEGHTWVVSPNQRTSHNTGCPECCLSGTSRMEQEMLSMIESWYHGEVTTHYRIGRHTVDVYLPDEKIAIDFNGVYWHSEACGKDADYHAKKIDLYRQSGIRLFYVWEDDWCYRRPIIERWMRSRLGVSVESRISARDTTVVELSPHEARKFMEDNHVQGFVSGTHYDALVSGDEVVALCITTVSPTLGYVRLDRYATSCCVRGGFSKLLALVVRREYPSSVQDIVTFSDNGISDGELYRATGFVRSGQIKPDYSYLYSGQRCHKFLFRKARFRKDPKLLYEEGLTERELALKNKIPRVWDSGKIRWSLPLRQIPQKKGTSHDQL